MEFLNHRMGVNTLGWKIRGRLNKLYVMANYSIYPLWPDTKVNDIARKIFLT